MDTAKILDVHYIPFNNFCTTFVMFISNGLLCAFRSAKMNLIEKQNTKKKSDMDRKKPLFYNDWYIYQRLYHRLQRLLSNPPFKHFPIRNQSWPLCKKVKGQPRVISWTNWVVLACQLLYTRFQRNQPIGSKDNFKGFLPYMGMAVILVMWPGSFQQTFIPHPKEDLH